MNIIEESFRNNSGEQKNGKNIKTIILISIILIIFIIIGIIVYLSYIKSSQLKVYMDGQLNNNIKNSLIFEDDGTVYFPIKETAEYFGYQSYNGEYTNKSESKNKCYVQSDSEVANVSLGSNKIYKLDLTKNSSDYQYVYSKEQIKSKQGILCAEAETAEKIFNISFEYDKAKNTIYIETTPYLIEVYSNKVLDYGYAKISDNFTNQKAILNGILVVENENSKVGVLDLDGNVVLEDKYDEITYLSDTGDFLVKANNKVGIISKNKENKVQIIYDDIKLMDSDAGLYLVKKDNKYGVIDFQGNIKVYIENENIGIDSTRFAENNIKNNYLLVDNLIPIKKDGYWGLFNKNGTQLVEFKYDSLGYIASNNKNALNLLVIPDYNVIVACKDNKYTLINSSGQELFPTVADDIYMTIEGDQTHYYIAVNNGKIDAIEYLENSGIKTTNNTDNSDNNSSSNTNSNSDNSQESNTENDTGSGEENLTEQQSDENQDNSEENNGNDSGEEYSEDGQSNEEEQ